MKKNVFTTVMLVVMLLLPLAAPIIYMQPAREPIKLDVTIDDDMYSIIFQKSGYMENATNVTLNGRLYVDNSNIDGSLEGWVITQNMTNLTLSHTGDLVSKVSPTLTYVKTSGTLYLETTVNSSLISQAPNLEEKMLPTTLYLEYMIESSIYNINRTETSSDLSLKINISDGLPYVTSSLNMSILATEGDFALWLNLSIESSTDREANITSGRVDIRLDMETGVPAADAQIVTMISTFAPLFLNENTIKNMLQGIVVDPEINLDYGLVPGDSSQFYITITYSGKIPPEITTPQQPIMPGTMPINMTIPSGIQNIIRTPNIATTEPANISLAWAFNLDSNNIGDNYYNLSFTGSLTGEIEQEAITTPFKFEAKCSLDNGYYDVYVNFESSQENPVAGLLAMKTVGGILYTLLPEGTPIEISIDTKGDVRVLDTSTRPPKEVSKITLFARSMEGRFPLDSLAIAYGNTIIDTTGGGLTIVADEIVKLDTSVIAQIDEIKVEGPGIEVPVGNAIVIDHLIFNIDSNKDSVADAMVLIEQNSTLTGTLKLEVLSKDKAQDLIDIDKYEIVGTPLGASGLVNGTAKITLALDSPQTNVKILKVTESGVVELTPTRVSGAVVEFETDSFSSFIPVVEKSPQETTTETTTQTQTTTTTKTTETTETMTETTETTTTTQTTQTTQTTTTEKTTETTTQTRTTTTGTTTTETTITTPTETKTTTTKTTTEKTTTTGGETTGTQTQSPTQTGETKTTEEKTTETTMKEGGINPIVIGVVALVIIIAAALYILRR